jgi:hypothetical protein
MWLVPPPFVRHATKRFLLFSSFFFFSNHWGIWKKEFDAGKAEE